VPQKKKKTERKKKKKEQQGFVGMVQERLRVLPHKKSS
jgi:hypothetical protein